MGTYIVKISNNGVIKEIEVSANDSNSVMSILQNMYGNSNVQILNIIRK